MSFLVARLFLHNKMYKLRENVDKHLLKISYKMINLAKSIKMYAKVISDVQ